MNMSVASNLLK
jgi:aubergine-like protein